MKKVLVVIPSLGLGGTNSSLDSIYNSLKDEIEFSIYSISKYDKNESPYSFGQSLLPYNFFLYLLDGIFIRMNAIEKILAFFLKIFKRIILKLYPSFIDFIYKKCIDKIGTIDNYDAIIAFQEGFTTHFVSLFPHKNKISWIHCNYCEVVPEGVSNLSIYERFNRIVCVSKFTTQCFNERYPILSHKVCTIYNLLNNERINGYVIKERNDNILRLISVGRIDCVKRFSYIPQIVDDVVDRGGDIHWIIIGGVSNDVEEGERLTKALSEMKHKNRVSWIGAVNNPSQYMSESDLLVCLSSSEACPMVFIEAKTVGVPILTTNFGSAPEFVSNGKEGVIISIDKIEETILTLYKDKPKLEEYKSYLKGFKYKNEDILHQIKGIL